MRRVDSVRPRLATERFRSRVRRLPAASKIVVIEERMTSTIQSLARLSDSELLAAVKRLAMTARYERPKEADMTGPVIPDLLR
jgi:hypothetical protein